ncbi:CRISPR-associated endonuclease Cas3'' [Vreelandella sp. TE19]
MTKQLAAQLGIQPEPMRRLLVFLLGLHDLGKFSRAFQEVLKLALDDMAPPQGKPYKQRHDRLGVLLWDACWNTWRKDGVLRWPEASTATKRKLLTPMDHLMAPFFGHHGYPVATGQLTFADFFVDDGELDDAAAAGDFFADWAALVGPDWPVEKLLDQEWLARFKALSWTIAGWATLSDWQGSNRDYFPYCQQAMALADYWPRALEQAEAVLDATGFARPPEPVSYAGLAQWFSGKVTPTPLQQKAEELPLQAGPQLFIL